MGTIPVGSDDGTLYILNKYSGKEEWAYSPGCYLFNSPVSSSPVVYDETVYFAAENGYIYSLKTVEKGREVRISIRCATWQPIIITVIGHPCRLEESSQEQIAPYFSFDW